MIHKFEEMLQAPNFNFLGNVPINDQLSISDLQPYYNAFVFSYGASEDNLLNIPNETTTKDVISARSFVGWYNGLPKYRDLSLDLTKTDTAVIIGNGNVALDVARILLTDVNVLRTTDITEYALVELGKSKIRNVTIVGRRGPLQMAFTAKELREMMNLPGTKFSMDEELLRDELLRNAKDLSKDRVRKRLMQILEQGLSSSNFSVTSEKNWSLKFLRTPKEIITRNENIHGIKLEINRLEYLKDAIDIQRCVAVGTGVFEDINCGLMFRSIGYRSIGIPGIPFDDRFGRIPNVNGKILKDGVEVI